MNLNRISEKFFKLKLKKEVIIIGIFHFSMDALQQSPAATWHHLRFMDISKFEPQHLMK